MSGSREPTSRTDDPSRDDGAAGVSPSASLHALDERELDTLRAIGREWDGCVPAREEWERALPVDPRLSYAEGGERRRGRFVHVRSGRPQHPEDLEATVSAAAPRTWLGRVGFLARRVLLGPPVRSTAVGEERMRRPIALAVLSSDALSSVAYGPEAMLAVLVLAGSGRLGLALPIGAAIAVLMLAVGLGYRQVIRAYPHGGGSYVVARANLGPLASLLAGAGLILDYTLTVAVSTAAGVAAVTSAIPSLHADSVPIGLATIALLVAGNLRGVRAAGAAFAGPTYMFVVAVALVVGVGLVDAAGRGFHPTPPPRVHPVEGLGLLLVLRAFASGSTAMTGIEAISNAVPAFRPPEAVNARRTLSVMIFLLISLFAGTVVLAHLDGAAPTGGETVLSQLGHRSLGAGALYGYVQAATALILLLAANAAFNGFPRLLFFMARDSYVPRQFLRLGDRLAFSNGILVLAIAAAVLFAGFGGKTDALIPLYAVGVFLAFTLSQTGMVIHWWRHRESHWRKAMATNALGAVLSGAVLAITAVTKFTAGAWVTVVLIPLIVVGCRRVRGHYEHARQALTPHAHAGNGHVPRRRLAPQRQGESDEQNVEEQATPADVSNLAIVPVATLDLASLRALSYAVSLGQPVLAVHISPDEQEAGRFHGYWEAWGEHLPLEVVVSPFRATIVPLANYVEALHRQRPDVTLTVVVPEIVVKRPWHELLHNHTAARLRRALRAYPGIVVTSVLFHLPG